MDVAEVRDQLARINGIAERSELICSDYWLARAVAEGVIHRVACGRYALPGIASAERAALSAGGVLSHGSAAVAYGWSVLVPPARPQVMVPRGRKLTTGRVAADVRWGVLSDAEREARLTTPLRTVVDCCRTLPFVEALGIAAGRESSAGALFVAGTVGKRYYGSWTVTRSSDRGLTWQVVDTSSWVPKSLSSTSRARKVVAGSSGTVPPSRWRSNSAIYTWWDASSRARALNRAAASAERAPAAAFSYRVLMRVSYKAAVFNAS